MLFLRVFDINEIISNIKKMKKIILVMFVVVLVILLKFNIVVINVIIKKVMV